MNPALLSILIGFRTLRVNPLRTALSTLGVIIGVAALVSVLALGDGMEAFAREQLRNTTALQMVEVRAPLGREVNGVWLPDTTAPHFTVQQAESLAALPGATIASMHLMAPGLVRHGAVEHATLVRGAMASLAERDSLTLTHGRFFTAEEVRAAAPVVVLSELVATALAGAQSVASLVGERITIQGEPAEVIGVLAAPRAASGGPAQQPRPTVLAPISSAPRYQMAREPQRPNILITAASIEEVPLLRDRIATWIAANHPEWNGKVEARADDYRGDQARRGILLFKVLMGAMTGISLVVGGIGIMNVLLASVAERTREIGIRKATGARQRDILVQFLSESVAISGMGSAIGLVTGFATAVGATAIMRHIAESPVRAGFSLSTFLVTASAAILVGLVFGTYPALRAARMSPVEAMHVE